MMENLFEIIRTQEEEGKRLVTVRLNGQHPIYQAHFPNHPITPGAILTYLAIQLVASEGVDASAVKSVKFLQPHHPQEHEQLTFVFNPDGKPVDVVIKDGDLVFAKMTLVF